MLFSLLVCCSKFSDVYYSNSWASGRLFFEAKSSCNFQESRVVVADGNSVSEQSVYNNKFMSDYMSAIWLDGTYSITRKWSSGCKRAKNGQDSQLREDSYLIENRKIGCNTKLLPCCVDLYPLQLAAQSEAPYGNETETSFSSSDVSILFYSI